MIAALMEASVAATGRTPRMGYGDVVCGAPVPLDSLGPRLLDIRQQSLPPPAVDLITGHARLSQASVNVSLRFPFPVGVL